MLPRIGFLAIAVCLAFGQNKPGDSKRKSDPNKLPEIAVELRVEREEGRIKVDGKVKNIGIKPLDGVVLFFEFLESGVRMISRMTTVAAEHAMDPGEEAEFLTQTSDQVLAVQVQIGRAHV